VRAHGHRDFRQPVGPRGGVPAMAVDSIMPYRRV
jgi:hypothetical protein